MGRKFKFSKEEKIEACEKYINGYGSITSIAKEIGCNPEGLRQWYLKYKIHGPNAFSHSNRNRSYTKEFKLSVVSLYLSGKYSYPDLSAKYNIMDSTIRKWVNKYYNGIELNNYDPKGEVYTMKSRKTTFEERLEIVKWVISNGMNYKEAASKFAINYANVYKWTKAYLKGGVEALEYKKRGPKHKNSVYEVSLTEIERLKLELEKERALRKRREFELEVLKKKEEFEKKNRYQK
ncbi:transposase [Wukongibacter sp. M2B1]|uniref:transposase n=1 Tax=Wukongibacter sp. M2B1 TaxID=3088895 RepID=UPI003D7B09A6